jgi:hypothetical protein
MGQPSLARKSKANRSPAGSTPHRRQSFVRRRKSGARAWAPQKMRRQLPRCVTAHASREGSRWADRRRPLHTHVSLRALGARVRFRHELVVSFAGNDHHVGGDFGGALHTPGAFRRAKSFGMKRGFGRSRKLLKEWWPGTESNRRRQPFQDCLATRRSGSESGEINGPQRFTPAGL